MAAHLLILSQPAKKKPHGHTKIPGEKHTQLEIAKAIGKEKSYKNVRDKAINLIEKLEMARTDRGNVNYEVAQAVKEAAAKDLLNDAKEFIEAMRNLIRQKYKTGYLIAEKTASPQIQQHAIMQMAADIKLNLKRNELLSLIKIFGIYVSKSS